MSVGTDYFGPDLSSNELAGFEDSLVDAFPRRIVHGTRRSDKRDPKDRDFEFSSAYVFALVEWAAAYETSMPRAEAFDVAIEDMIAFIKSDSNEVVSHRIVSHLEVREPISLADGKVDIRPLGDLGWLDVAGVTGLPGLEGEECFLYSNVPHALVSARATYRPRVEWSEQLKEPSNRIESVVMGLRLFRRTSARNISEWSGFCQPGSFVRPLSHSWSYDMITASALADAEYIASLNAIDVGAFETFTGLLDTTIEQVDALASKRNLGTVGWFSALSSFQDSFGFDRWADQVPRLIRAIEGALLPEAAGEAVKSRLRQCLCLLLQVDADSCDALFRDIGHLYDLRSEVEHAADVKVAKLLSRLRSVASTDKRGDGFSEWRAIETLRDLARRSIVARIVLATGAEPEWPIDDTESIEGRLLEDGYRARCRERLAAADGELGIRLLGHSRG